MHLRRLRAAPSRVGALSTGPRLTWDDLRRGREVIVPAGELQMEGRGPFAVIGVNGAGKSTLLMALAGVLSPGTCRIDGRATDDLRVGYVPQEYPLPAWLRGRELARALGLPARRLEEGSAGFHLGEFLHRSGRALSPGQAQILAAALAFEAPAGVMVLDEPFAALDMRRRASLRERIRSVADEHLVFLSSQSGADLLELCDSFILIRSGRIVFSGALMELLDGAPAAASDVDRFERAVVARIA